MALATAFVRSKCLYRDSLYKVYELKQQKPSSLFLFLSLPLLFSLCHRVNLWLGCTLIHFSLTLHTLDTLQDTVIDINSTKVLNGKRGEGEEAEVNQSESRTSLQRRDLHIRLLRAIETETRVKELSTNDLSSRRG